MDLSTLTEAIRRDAALVVFVNVFLQQLGLPIPAVPTLLLVGGLLGGQVFWCIVAMVLASVVADWLWYLAGRAFGYRVLNGLCRLSINPASCVSKTEDRFVRWGLWSLIVAKFIPGFSTVAPPIAGAMRMSLPGFLGAAAVGAFLWGGSAMLAGWLLRTELQAVLAALDRHGGNVALVLAVLFAIWLAWKFWQKSRFEQLADMPHITPGELLVALASEQPLRLLDLRGPVAIAESGLVRGAVAADYQRPEEALADWPKEAPIVTLCACPQDAAAVLAARRLMARGYTSVRPLGGGYDALPESLRPAGSGL